MLARVFIVGAGPGDPGLITVRGRRRLETADVVVYDRRVAPALLRLARADAEKIEVGAAAPRPLDQDAISLLVAEKAREGRTVVRLKWGDPFIFDSGGKEALFLHEQGIPFLVIPGIPAAIAVPAYAGIPTTYPGAGDVVVLVRGFEGSSDAMPSIDWARLAGLDGTIVCFAAPKQIARLTAELLLHGRSPAESAALVYRGTTTGQETTVATLADIAGQARADEPAMIIIGAVVGLREHLRWFDDRPLFGKRIVITRPREQAEELVEMLEERGAEAILAPTVRIMPTADLEAVDAACREIGTYDGLVLTSANAVDSFMRRLLAVGDVRELKGVRVCVTGAA